MKKALFAVPLVLVVSSCAGAPGAASVSVPDIPFTASAEIGYGGIELCADITRSAPGKWEFSITEPYALEGLTMTFTDGSCRLNMLGMESAADLGNDAVSMAKAVAGAYDAAVSSSDAVKTSDDIYTLSGTSPLGSFTLDLDKSGTPVSFTSDAGSLTVKLSGFTQLSSSDVQAELVE